MVKPFTVKGLGTRLASEFAGLADKKGLVLTVESSSDDIMRYRPGVEIALAKRWSLDAFYCYQYASSQGRHIAGIEVGYSF